MMYTTHTPCIHRYLDGCGEHHLSTTMLYTKLGKALEEDNWREAEKCNNTLKLAVQHKQPHGEEVALLDLHPWGSCNEDALVQNYVDSVPLRKSKKKRRECPVAASVLFRNNGPHVTGKANMAAIAAYDKAKREEAAAKAARRLATKQKRAHKRQEGTMEVVKLAVQQLLLTQTPPLQYYDESHDVVSRPFKPDTHACKKFMQMSVCVCMCRG